MGNGIFDKDKNIVTGTINRFKSFIKTIFSPVKIGEQTLNESAGNIYGISSDELTRSYDDVRRASLLCERALIIAGQLADLALKQQTLKEKLIELEKFEKLSEEKKQYITNILQKYKDIKREKQSLRGQLSSFTKILDYLEPLEKEVPEAIKAIDEAEDMQRLVKQDMNYIEGERSELEFQSEYIKVTLENIHRISIGLIVLFSIITVLLLFLYLIKGIDIFYYGLYASVAMIVLATMVFILRRRLVFESKLNVLLRIRAVELLNKKKLLYVHYTRFINYEYKKYRVNSAYELRENWKEYDYYKHVTTRYINVRNIGYTVEDELQEFLMSNNLQNSKTSVESFAKILDFENNKKQYKRFSQQINIIEAKLSSIENEQKEIWDEFEKLRDRDLTKDKVIEKMMDEYFEDISKVLPFDDGEDGFDYSYGYD